MDYADTPSLVNIFTKYNVDTVLATLTPTDPGTFKTAQASLLAASEEVSSVRRFAPTDWAFGIPLNDPKFLPAAYLPKLEIVPRLRDSSLNWQEFSPGMFLDYFYSGAPDRIVDGVSTPATGYLYPLKFVIDIEQGTADIPLDETGKAGPVVFTTVVDVAKFVVAATQLDGAGWTEGSGKLIGWRGTYEEALEIAKRVTG